MDDTGTAGESALGLLIEQVWAFVAIDEDGTERVVSVPLVPGVTVPALAADVDRVDALRPLVERFARMTGKRIQLRRFDAVAMEAEIGGRTIDLRSKPAVVLRPRRHSAEPPQDFGGEAGEH